MASHIMDLHQGIINTENDETDIDLDLLRKYITYAKVNCAPRLSEEAGAVLKSFYIKDREEAQIREKNAKGHSRIPITVRQLEAIIRMSEALAKIQMKNEVTRWHVEEAHRLFKISTLDAANSGFSTSFNLPDELKDDVRRVQEIIRRKFALGTKLTFTKLQADLEKIFTNTKSIEYAILGMVKNEEIKHFEQRRILQRIK